METKGSRSGQAAGVTAVLLVAGGAFAGRTSARVCKTTSRTTATSCSGSSSRSRRLDDVGRPGRRSADPTLLVTAAKGLSRSDRGAGAGAPNLDQMALWPNDAAPTYVIGCNEQGAGQFGVVAINLADGSSFPIVRAA